MLLVRLLQSRVCANTLNLLKLPKDVSVWLFSYSFHSFSIFVFAGGQRGEGGARADTLTWLKLSKDVSGLLFSYSFNYYSIFVLEEGVRGEREEEGVPLL